MIEVSFSSSFLRAYKKIIKGNKTLEGEFNDKLQIFLVNPYDNRLKTHKLSGKLSSIWSFSINFQIRVTFYFVESTKVIFEYIGTHNEVY
jgi:mRNA-degrading endonuclease YafQ of YafQ-DinJ toxin-antitoxin module